MVFLPSLAPIGGILTLLQAVTVAANQAGKSYRPVGFSYGASNVSDSAYNENDVVLTTESPIVTCKSFVLPPVHSRR